MLSNAYFLAKFCFDTAENEPAKNLQKFANFPNFANPKLGGPQAAQAGAQSALSVRVGKVGAPSEGRRPVGAG